MSMFRKIIYLIMIITLSALVFNTGHTGENNKIDIIFSHQFHIVEQEFECTSCHIDIDSSSLASDDNLPTMDECGSCHDVEDDETCSLCHRNPEEPSAIERIEREIIFNHQFHLNNEVNCDQCHTGINNSTSVEQQFSPPMSKCMTCHDGQKADNACAKCHGGKITLSDIHPLDWRHQHGDEASTRQSWCLGCHTQNQFCLDCHFGDNLNGNIHQLNYQYTHGLDVQSKKTDCAKCHSRRMFCVSCHESGNRMPLAHSTTNWTTRHGQAARDDIENCASCHESADPTCALSGCHNDFDGVRGTNPDIHADDLNMFDDEHGIWHDDNSYFCYQCHLNTNTTGVGFCGYCHSSVGD